MFYIGLMGGPSIGKTGMFGHSPASSLALPGMTGIPAGVGDTKMDRHMHAQLMYMHVSLCMYMSKQHTLVRAFVHVYMRIARIIA